MTDDADVTVRQDEMTCIRIMDAAAWMKAM